MMQWGLMGILLGVCAVLCAVGFYKFVYFLSIGYGFAIAGGAVAVLAMVASKGYTQGILWLAVLQMVLFVAYGARLSGFLLYREIKSAAYKKTMKEEIGAEKKMPIFVLVTIWVFVAVLYAIQLSPMLYRYTNGCKDFALPIVGMVISVAGLILEALADKQKSAQKKENPNMVATKGLYKIVRCPNYFGEITFWTGVFVSGISAYKSAGQWAMAIIAYVSIVYIMFNGAQRLEKRQMERYGSDKAYNDYADKTPIIIPLIPVYHLNKKK